MRCTLMSAIGSAQGLGLPKRLAVSTVACLAKSFLPSSDTLMLDMYVEFLLLCFQPSLCNAKKVSKQYVSCANNLIFILRSILYLIYDV